MAPSRGELLAVTVVYAGPERVWSVALELPPGVRVGEAVAASGLVQSVPELAARWRAGGLDLGVFNRPCTPERLLQTGDRVEIYRPLQIDPKEARHLRVAARRKALANERRAASRPGGPPPAKPAG